MDKYYQVKTEELDEIIQENKTLKANASVLQEYITKNEQMKENVSALAKKCHTYKSALEEIREMFLNQVAWVGQLTNFEEEIYNKINEVLNEGK